MAIGDAAGFTLVPEARIGSISGIPGMLLISCCARRHDAAINKQKTLRTFSLPEWMADDEFARRENSDPQNSGGSWRRRRQRDGRIARHRSLKTRDRHAPLLRRNGDSGLGLDMQRGARRLHGMAAGSGTLFPIFPIAHAVVARMAKFGCCEFARIVVSTSWRCAICNPMSEFPTTRLLLSSRWSSKIRIASGPLTPHSASTALARTR